MNAFHHLHFFVLRESVAYPWVSMFHFVTTIGSVIRIINIHGMIGVPRILALTYLTLYFGLFLDGRQSIIHFLHLIRYLGLLNV